MHPMEMLTMGRRLRWRRSEKQEQKPGEFPWLVVKPTLSFMKRLVLPRLLFPVLVSLRVAILSPKVTLRECIYQ